MKSTTIQTAAIPPSVIEAACRAAAANSRPAADPDGLVPLPRGQMGMVPLWRTYEHFIGPAVAAAFSAMKEPNMPSDTNQTGGRLSDNDKGFRLGIAVAVGFLVHGHGEDSLAKELLEISGLTIAKALTAGAVEYDVSAIRKAMR